MPHVPFTFKSYIFALPDGGLYKKKYLTIDSGGYVYEQPSCINCRI